MSRLSDLQMWYEDSIVMLEGKPYRVQDIERTMEGEYIAYCRRVFNDRISSRTKSINCDQLDFLCPDPQYIQTPSGAVWWCRRNRQSYKRGLVLQHWSGVDEISLFRHLNGEPNVQEGNIESSPFPSRLSKHVAVVFKNRKPLFSIMGGAEQEVEHLAPCVRDFILSEVDDAYKSLLQ